MSIVSRAFSVVTLAVAVLGFNLSSASADPMGVSDQIRAAEMIKELLLSARGDMIDWQVGDRSEFHLSSSAFGGSIGVMSKSVIKEEGQAIWVRQETNLDEHDDIVEVLINRADGRILKYIHNGKPEALPENKFEIISQGPAEVTVPAGTFKSLHTVARSPRVPRFEIWTNSRDTVMEGTIKQISKNQLFDLVVELTSFRKSS